MTEPISSKTHCPYCGRPRAGDAEWSRHEGQECTEPCWCATYCWFGCEVRADERVAELFDALQRAEAENERLREAITTALRFDNPKAADILRAALRPNEDGGDHG